MSVRIDTAGGASDVALHETGPRRATDKRVRPFAFAVFLVR